MALNRVIVMGRLVADPVLRYTQGAQGKPVASLRIAVERDYTDQSGNRGADFFDVTAWNKIGENVSKYFKKGMMAIVEGRLESTAWQDKNGNKRVSISINAERVRFGEAKKAQDGAPAQQGYDGAPNYTGQDFEAIDDMENEEDLPF